MAFPSPCYTHAQTKSLSSCLFQHLWSSYILLGEIKKGEQEEKCLTMAWRKPDDNSDTVSMNGDWWTISGERSCNSFTNLRLDDYGKKIIGSFKHINTQANTFFLWDCKIIEIKEKNKEYYQRKEKNHKVIKGTPLARNEFYGVSDTFWFPLP